MTATAFLELKQKATRLNERERRQLSEYLIRLGHSKDSWKREMTRRLDRMEKGEKVNAASFRKSLGS